MQAPLEPGPARRISRPARRWADEQDSSRRGRTCRPSGLVLTAGQAADSPRFVPALRKAHPSTRRAGSVPGPTLSPRTRPPPPAPTAPTCANATSRQSSRRRRTRPPTGRRRAPGRPPHLYDADLCRESNSVERLINTLKAWRGITTPYDKKPESYPAALHLRASMIWTNDVLKAAG